jgi:hypothetical protein
MITEPQDVSRWSCRKSVVHIRWALDILDHTFQHAGCPDSVGGAGWKKDMRICKHDHHDHLDIYPEHVYVYVCIYVHM